MPTCYSSHTTTNPIQIILVTKKDYPTWLEKQKITIKHWLTSSGFRPEPNQFNLIPGTSGKLSKVLCCISDQKNFWSIGHLPLALPEGDYTLKVSATDFTDHAIAWGLGSYQFSTYKKSQRKPAKLVLPEKSQSAYIKNIVKSIYLVRDLINTPTENMGPTELANAATELAKTYNATCQQIIGDHLLTQNYPIIHTVGRACDDAPRLIDIRWGDANHPKVVLVGKGVCFDTGGLDLKNAANMLLMKKDMGGAAHVLGLARMIMQAKLPINLRVLIPAVENSVAGNAYRPGDVIKSRKGMTIEIGNTDAEGRLVLADALTEAVSEKPELIIDMATLTGAARIALGTDLPALFSNQDTIAEDIIRHSARHQDPVWRMPLYSAYREMLNSNIADINNAGADVYGGAITAALFLKEFIPDQIPWVHLDMMAWNLKTRPGRPIGGEAMTLRGIFSYLNSRFVIPI